MLELWLNALDKYYSDKCIWEKYGNCSPEYLTEIDKIEAKIKQI